ncbi:unnamed protein product, partial [Prunus brigantina]
VLSLVLEQEELPLKLSLRPRMNLDQMLLALLFFAMSSSSSLFGLDLRYFIFCFNYVFFFGF